MKEKYAPLSLDYEVLFKDELKSLGNCHYTPSNKTLNEIIAEESKKIVSSYPTVFLFGQTGAGKSYFANALSGETNPVAGSFAVGTGMHSQTKLVRVSVHDFFKNEKRDYGIESFKLNILDSPGFSDDDFKDIDSVNTV